MLQSFSGAMFARQWLRTPVLAQMVARPIVPASRGLRIQASPRMMKPVPVSSLDPVQA